MAPSAQDTTNSNNETRETKTLLDSAKSTTQDLYALLDLPSPLTQHATHEDPTTLSEQAIRKAYRRAALVHHPDKNPNNASAAAKFDEINKAYEILISPEARTVYDERQKALRAKAERQQAFEGKRKRMKEELERRESAGRRQSGDVFGESASTPVGTPAGAKGGPRRWNAGAGAGASPGTPKLSEEKEAELRRLAAEGARRRQEQTEKMKRRRQTGGDAGELSEERDDSAKSNNGGSANLSDGESPASRSFTFSTPSASKKGASADSDTERGAVAGSGVNGGPAKGSTLFQSTMARLKEAERKRREDAALRDSASAADANG